MTPSEREAYQTAHRTLTPQDLADIKKAVTDHSCRFDEHDRVVLKALADIDPNVLSKLVDTYSNATNRLWKGVISIVFTSVVALVLLGEKLTLPWGK